MPAVFKEQNYFVFRQHDRSPEVYEKKFFKMWLFWTIRSPGNDTEKASPCFYKIDAFPFKIIICCQTALRLFFPWLVVSPFTLGFRIWQNKEYLADCVKTMFCFGLIPRKFQGPLKELKGLYPKKCKLENS